MLVFTASFKDKLHKPVPECHETNSDLDAADDTSWMPLLSPKQRLNAISRSILQVNLG